MIEGKRLRPISRDEIIDYLRGLSDVCGMTVLIDPVTHRSDRYGWAGWIHWETSGAHFYAWDVPEVFFSVDIYTCKAFDSGDAIALHTRVLRRGRDRREGAVMDLALRELAESVIESSGAEQPFSLHLIASTDAAAELGRSVEREVFGEVFGNSPELLAAEYAQYEPASVFLVVLDNRRLLPAGVMRLIVSGAQGLKSLDDIERVWGQPIDAVVAALVARSTATTVGTSRPSPSRRSIGGRPRRDS